MRDIILRFKLSQAVLDLIREMSKLIDIVGQIDKRVTALEKERDDRVDSS